MVYALKQFAGKVPLPKNPRRKRLAQGIELGVLFSMGVVEEVLRWGLVRILVGLEGGAGGYRGQATCSVLEWIATGNAEGSGRTCPSIWEGVYFMGWIWSFVECMVGDFSFVR